MTDETKRVDLTHWKKNADGTINIQPVVGWDCVPFTIAGILRLQFAPERDKLDHPETLQFGMSAAQCTALAQDLLKMAASLTKSPKPGTPAH